jgi:hypothetical protein
MIDTGYVPLKIVLYVKFYYISIIAINILDQL